MRISDWSSDVCSSDLRMTRTGSPQSPRCSPTAKPSACPPVQCSRAEAAFIVPASRCPAFNLSLANWAENGVMAQAIALYREQTGTPQELLRGALVLLCALALIAAGPAFPF